MNENEITLSIKEKLSQMHELEQKADAKKHKMMSALSEAFILRSLIYEYYSTMHGYIKNLNLFEQRR